MVQTEAVSKASHLAGDVAGGHGGDEAGGGAEGVDLALRIREPPVPPVDFIVDDDVGQRMGMASEYLGQAGRSFPRQDLRWVLAGLEIDA